jgi:hypothetical protein
MEVPMTPRRGARLLVGLTAVVLLGWVSCIGAVWWDGSGQYGKQGSGELRTDVGPLTSRWPVLGEPGDVRWMGGRFGRSRGFDPPGPSTVWLDAVIAVDPDQVDEWLSSYSFRPAGVVPEVVDGMVEHLPPGPFLRSDEFDTVFNEQTWHVEVYLDPAAGELVLVWVRAP